MLNCFICDLQLVRLRPVIFCPDESKIICMSNESFIDDIINLTRQYDNYSVVICGNKDYTSHFVKRIQEKEKLKYNKNLIEFKFQGEDNNE